MRHISLQLAFFLLTCPIYVHGQGVFKNQSEQETFWTKQLFYQTYEKQDHERFKGEILILSKSIVKFADDTLNIDSTDPFILKLLSLGILYPRIKSESKLLSGKQLYDSIVNPPQLSLFTKLPGHHFVLSNFEELTFFQTLPTVKRFRFLLKEPGLHNPIVCFIELTNLKANKSTDLSNFINGAKLTFYKKAWIMV